MFIALGSFRWQKHEFEYDAIKLWLERINYRTDGNLIILEIDAPTDEIQVDGMGSVIYPEGKLVSRKEFDLSELSPGMLKAGKLYDQYLSFADEAIWELIDPES